MSDTLQQGQLLQRLAGALRDRTERIFGDVDRESGLFAQKAVKPFEKGASTCEDDPAVDEVGCEFGRAAFQCGAHGIDDGAEWFRHGLTDFLGVYLDRLR